MDQVSILHCQIKISIEILNTSFLLCFSKVKRIANLKFCCSDIMEKIEKETLRGQGHWYFGLQPYFFFLLNHQLYNEKITYNIKLVILFKSHLKVQPYSFHIWFKLQYGWKNLKEWQCLFFNLFGTVKHLLRMTKCCICILELLICERYYRFSKKGNLCFLVEH